MARLPKALSPLLILGLLLAGPAAALAAPKVGVVDVREAMKQTDHWKDAYDKLEKEKAQRQVMIEAEKTKLRTKRDALEAKKAVSDPAALAAEEEALAMEAQKFMREFQMNQQILTVMEQQLADEMLKRIEAVVKQLSQEMDLDFVFEAGFDGKPNVLYSAKGVDITDQVAAAYKKFYKGQPLPDPKVPGPQR